jgi:homogentisate phytyltransferase / homogentisate geranylgeranyltransferase
MNLYITGLNQVTDIEIDKVNKPYLPLAAGTLTRSNGIAVVVMSLIASLLLVRTAAWPLQATVLGSGLLGTLYSLPPFRLKRFPMLAAFCILVVRGSLVNMGFFFQAKADVMKTALPSLLGACRQFPESVVLTAFFAVFGIVIALMKDVPDIDGDKKFNIPSFSVKRGAAAMFK